jgi:hypothetical protein
MARQESPENVAEVFVWGAERHHEKEHVESRDCDDAHHRRNSKLAPKHRTSDRVS